MSRNRNIWAAVLTLAAIGSMIFAAAVGATQLLGSSGEQPRATSLDLDGLMTAYRAERRQWIARQMSTKTVLGVPRSQLDAIGECESHGDPRSIGGGGLYRGKYQFDRGTWASVGGVGDPAAAPEYEQDRRAAMLLNRSGTSPWPVCG